MDVALIGKQGSVFRKKWNRPRTSKNSRYSDSLLVRILLCAPAAITWPRPTSVFGLSAFTLPFSLAWPPGFSSSWCPDSETGYQNWNYPLTVKRFLPYNQKCHTSSLSRLSNPVRKSPFTFNVTYTQTEVFSKYKVIPSFSQWEKLKTNVLANLDI